MASLECKGIGIDFGTTNTVVSIADNNQNVQVLNLDDGPLFKSLLYFPKRSEAFFGNHAINEYVERGMEGRFFQSVKRLLPNPDFTGTSLYGQHVGVEDLVARFLQETKKRIEQKLNQKIETFPICMGRPARYSNDPAHEGLAVVRFKKAIELAQFNSPLKLVEEPVAAAASMANDTVSDNSIEGYTLIADLGGGTSDFSLYHERIGKTPEVLSVHGVSVAGDALDSDFFVSKLNPIFGSEIKYQRPFSSNILTMPTSIVKSLPKWHHHAFLKERATWGFITTLKKELVDQKQKPLLENLITLVEDNCGYKLHQAVESLKIKLSSENQSPFVFKSYPIDILFDVLQTDWNQMIQVSVDQITKTAIDTCRIAKVNPDDIKLIRFTGGTSQVPEVRQAIQRQFKNAKATDHNTFTAVSEGLALLASHDLRG